MSTRKRSAVIFGAGSVGRGFLGQLFTQSGYEAVLVDIDEPLLRALEARRGYHLRLVDNDGAPALNVIVCENMKDAAAHLRSLVRAALPQGLRPALDARVGFVETVIGRMVPPLTPEQRAQDPSAIAAEPYKELPVDRHGFVGEIPQIVGLQACDHFAAYVARKLYIHNGGHAVLAYLGHLRGLTYGYEALEDPVVRRLLEGAWGEAQAGIAVAHGVDAAWLEAHTADLRRRFANRALGDTVVRLARDPLRKLAAGDRLVGAARLAEVAGVPPRALAWAIAAGYCFDSPADPIAGRLQAQVARDGLAAALAAVSQIDPAEPLGHAVLERHARLRAGAWP